MSIDDILKEIEPDGWEQFIDGEPTQNVARNKYEYDMIVQMFNYSTSLKKSGAVNSMEPFFMLPKLRALAERVIREQREIDAILLNKSRSELQLMCGEMTAQEFRTVSAILMNRMVAIRSHPTKELSEAEIDKQRTGY